MQESSFCQAFPSRKYVSEVEKLTFEVTRAVLMLQPRDIFFRSIATTDGASTPVVSFSSPLITSWVCMYVECAIVNRKDADSPILFHDIPWYLLQTFWCSELKYVGEKLLSSERCSIFPTNGGLGFLNNDSLPSLFQHYRKTFNLFFFFLASASRLKLDCFKIAKFHRRSTCTYRTLSKIAQYHFIFFFLSKIPVAKYKIPI